MSIREGHILLEAEAEVVADPGVLRMYLFVKCSLSLWSGQQIILANACSFVSFGAMNLKMGLLFSVSTKYHLFNSD